MGDELLVEELWRVINDLDACQEKLRLTSRVEAVKGREELSVGVMRLKALAKRLEKADAKGGRRHVEGK